MNRRGFTIVEVLVAIVLLAVGVLGVAGVSVMAMRQTASADQQNVGALVALSRMERYRALSCTSLDAQLPVTTTDRGILVDVRAIGVGANTRTIAGRFTWTTNRGLPGKIADTTTVICS